MNLSCVLEQGFYPIENSISAGIGYIIPHTLHKYSSFFYELNVSWAWNGNWKGKLFMKGGMGNRKDGKRENGRTEGKEGIVSRQWMSSFLFLMTSAPGQSSSWNNFPSPIFLKSVVILKQKTFGTLLCSMKKKSFKSMIITRICHSSFVATGCSGIRILLFDNEDVVRSLKTEHDMIIMSKLHSHAFKSWKWEKTYLGGWNSGREPRIEIFRSKRDSLGAWKSQQSPIRWARNWKWWCGGWNGGWRIRKGYSSLRGWSNCLTVTTSDTSTWFKSLISNNSRVRESSVGGTFLRHSHCLNE